MPFFCFLGAITRLAHQATTRRDLSSHRLKPFPVACRSRRALAGLNPENPDRNDRREHG
jgi:hypothetical protein